MIKHNVLFSSELNGWWCLVYQHRVYLTSPVNQLPSGQFDELGLPVNQPVAVHQICDFQSLPVYMFDVSDDDVIDEADIELFVGVRSVLFSHNEMFEFVARAFQVALFLRTHKYCGQCGNEMTLIDWELATQCEPCKHRCYPRISPVIIVAIRKKDKILLAQGTRSTSGMYSVLAGFVESGETLEQTVHREVFEEVGIKVKNLKYQLSQPWPFPHSLMVGFQAEYDSGEINICEDEIVAADWYSLDDMPPTPPNQTISGRLIETTKKMMALAKR
jgi:NAD+ diphosphatase